MALADIFRKFMAQRADESARPQAGIRFGIPWPFLLALCIILVCAVAWAFFMGLMVGRGQNPHASIEEITGIRTSPAEEAAVPDSESALEQSPDMVPEKPAEELVTPVIVRTPPKPAPARQATPAQETRRKPSAGNERFDYVFQAGAYRNQNEAKAASTNLSKAGFRSSVRKSGKVWLVIVNLRGAQRQVDSLSGKMKELKMGKPMQLSKKETAKKTR